MAKQINLSVGGVVRKVTKVPASVGGVVKEMKKGVCGVGGVVREFFTGLDTNLTILGAHNAGYWTRAVSFGKYLNDWDSEEDGGNSYYVNVVDMMLSEMSHWGDSYVGDGGSIGSISSFEAYADSDSNAVPSQCIFAFFCPTKEHADALAECIKNRYTQMQSLMEYWGTNENRLLGVNRTVTITSVTSKGLCSEIGYKIYYTSSKYYNCSDDSRLAASYVVEILTDRCLYYDQDFSPSRYSCCAKFI